MDIFHHFNVDLAGDQRENTDALDIVSSLTIAWSGFEYDEKEKKWFTKAEKCDRRGPRETFGYESTRPVQHARKKWSRRVPMRRTTRQRAVTRKMQSMMPPFEQSSRKCKFDRLSILMLWPTSRPPSSVRNSLWQNSTGGSFQTKERMMLELARVVLPFRGFSPPLLTLSCFCTLHFSYIHFSFASCLFTSPLLFSLDVFFLCFVVIFLMLCLFLFIVCVLFSLPILRPMSF